MAGYDMSEGITIEAFVEREVATAEEWQSWLDVRDAIPPAGRTHIEINNFSAYPEKALPYASPDYKEKFSLLEVFRARLRELMIGDDWLATGTRGNSIERTDITKDEWHKQLIEIRGNWLGAKVHPINNVAIFRQVLGPNDQLLDFIKIVTSVLEPRTINKDQIRKLADALHRRKYSVSTFDRIWTKADVPKGWMKPGR